VNISGVGIENFNLKYKWQVSAGKIVGGQGTHVISVDTTDTIGQSVTATVEIDGLPSEYDRTESCSLMIYEHEPVAEARKVEEYGMISWNSEKLRLSNFNILMQQEPGSMGYVIIYGRRNVPQHLARVRKFLVEKRGLEPDRLQLINGGSNKKTKVELWDVPTGAAPPTAKPNF